MILYFHPLLAWHLGTPFWLAQICAQATNQKAKIHQVSLPRKNNKSPSQSVRSNTAEPPINSASEETEVSDAYLTMTLPQLRRKVKDLIKLKDKNKKTVDDTKKERNDLQKAKTTLEKEKKKELRDLSESHKNQIAAIHDIHAEDMAKKDATIHQYSVQLKELRKTSNIVSYKFININYQFQLFLFCYLLLSYYLYSYLLA